MLIQHVGLPGADISYGLAHELTVPGIKVLMLQAYVGHRFGKPQGWFGHVLYQNGLTSQRYMIIITLYPLPPPMELF